MAEQDAPPKYVQEQLGHSSIQMTMDIYSHLFPERDREWVVKQDRERENGRAICRPVATYHIRGRAAEC